MNPVPAVNVPSVNAPPPLSSAPAQTSTPGTLSKFQDLYQNLPSMQDQSQGDSQAADSTQGADPKDAFTKKKSPAGSDASAVAIAPAIWNIPAVPNAAHALALSLEQPSPPGAAPSQTVQKSAAATLEATRAGASAVHDAIQSSVQELELESGAGQSQVVSPGLLALSPAFQAGSALEPNADSSTELKDSSDARSKVPQAAVAAGAPTFDINPTSVTAPVMSNILMPSTLDAPAKAMEQSGDQPMNSSAGNANAPAHTGTTTSFGLNAGNLAFAIQLADAASQPDNPHATVTAIADAAATAVTTAAEVVPEPLSAPPAPDAQLPTDAPTRQTPPALSPAPSATSPRILPAVSVTGLAARIPAHADPAPHPAQAPSKTEPGPRDSINFAKPDTASRGQLSGGSLNAAPSAILNRMPSAFHQALPDNPAWLGVGAQADGRGLMTVSEPAALATPQLTSTPELQALNVAPAATNLHNHILLNVGDGQSSAAVRVVDRAGTVTVSVHATSPEVRDSLRSNLGDLTTQLNAQGLRAEVLKTVSAQPSSENHQEQGGQPQRQFSQQHSSPQSDRQAQRDRRTNSQWLQELAQQAGSNVLKTGGQNS